MRWILAAALLAGTTFGQGGGTAVAADAPEQAPPAAQTLPAAADPAPQSPLGGAPASDDAFADPGADPGDDFDPPPEGVEGPAPASASVRMAAPPPAAGGGHFAEPQSLDAASRLDALTPYLDGLAAAHLSDRYPPSMMIALATPTETLIRVYGYRDADKRIPADDKTLFRIASVSKTFIWVAVMMLVDEGKIDLAADVNTYLKRVRIKPAFGKPVTMNDLMAHRAGFEDTFGDFLEARSGKSFEESLIRHQPRRVAPPGERTSYSNWGADLAAQIVADVSGVSYEEFLRTRILAPLGMSSTVLHDPASAAVKALNEPVLDAATAAPHKLDKGAPKAIAHDPIDPTFAAGAMALTAGDGARWMQMFLGNGAVRGGKTRLLSADAFARMRQRNFPDRLLAPDFSHGFMETAIAGAQTYGHGGTLSGFIADMRIAPSIGLGVFVVVNGAEGRRVSDEISKAIIERVAGADPYSAPNPEKASDDLVKASAALAGVWRGARRVESRFEKLFAIGQDATILPQADGSVVTVTGADQKRWYPLDKDNYTDLGRDVMHVYRDASGNPVRLSSSMGTNTLIRAPFLQSAQGINLGATAAAFFSMLVFIGAWRRQGRMVDTTGTGVALGAAQWAVAIVWLGFIGAIGAATALLADVSIADLSAKGYPPAPLRIVQVFAYLSAAAFLGNAIASYWVWTRSGWSLWRKIHHLLFALSGLFVVWLLYDWRLILAPSSAP